MINLCQVWRIHPLVQKIFKYQKIFHLKDHDLENKVKVTKMLSALKLVTIIYICKFGENLSIGSKDIPLTRL